MPTYKLYYFPLRARAELVRMLFAYAGVEYEDIRIPREEWPAKKDGMPFKQIPVLEIDGKMLCQSGAIGRYLAREFGLYGSTLLVGAKADEFVDAGNDIFMSLPWREQDPEKKKELMKKAFEETVLPGLALLEANFVGPDYYAGELTYADIGFACGAEHLLKVNPKVLDGTPKLKAMVEKVNAIPNIAAWIKKRPISEM